MAESFDSFHSASDEFEFVDPYCDPCSARGLNVRVCGFCKDCFQFLCTDCHDVHGNLQACRHHDVVQGEDMPKSEADKPTRYDYCGIHPRQLKDQFCFEHKIQLCSLCSSADHEGCSTKTVEDACNYVLDSETDALYKNVKCLQKNFKSALSPIEKKMRNIKDQEKAMLNDAQKIYDQMIANAKNIFCSIKNEIQTSCQSTISDLSRHQKKVKDTIIKLNSPLYELREQRNKSTDAKLFLKLQAIVSFTMKFTSELRESSKPLDFESLSFELSQPFQEFLSFSFTIGTIRRSESKTDALIVVPEMFPIFPLKHAVVRPKTRKGNQEMGVSAAMQSQLRPVRPRSKMKAAEQGTYSVRQRGDSNVCCITGMAISNDRRILMVDHSNDNVKMFSCDRMFLLSSVSVSGPPYDIAVISDREAVVTTGKSSLVILDISGGQLSIKTTTQLSYDVQGICRYNNKLVVTSPDSKSSSVKLIDKTGRVYWSVSSDKQGQPLFRYPWYVSSPGDGRSSTVIVTDYDNNTLTLLNGDTGNVITRHELKEGKGPMGATTDSDGNVYVCYWVTSEVVVISADLAEEKILLYERGELSGLPRTIMYDGEADRLIVSYLSLHGYDEVDIFMRPKELWEAY